MQRPFAVFDIDGTIIRWQLLHATIDALGKQQHIPDEIYQNIRKARLAWKQRTETSGFDTYEKELVKAIRPIMKGLPEAIFVQAAQTVFDKHKDQTYVYTRNLIAELKKKNYLLFAISGSQSEAVSLLADYYGFDDYMASHYERTNGTLTGEVQLTVGSKDRLLTTLAAKHQASFSGSIAVGDSESDIAMLATVEHPVAFNPTKKLFAHARAHQWPIVVERKNVVYQLEPTHGDYILANA
ncbi:MAG TPA: HAD family phosphatase [Nevskiaceae bacterium]|nr:HAD family phosphatase [Nevskiaceae bacterium]